MRSFFANPFKLKNNLPGFDLKMILTDIYEFVKHTAAGQPHFLVRIS